MLPDRSILDAFVAALFPHADGGTYIALRAFADGSRNKPPVVNNWGKVDDPRLSDWVYNSARQAAEHAELGNFCPPVATFKNPTKALEADIANGVAVSVELDERPQASLAKLSLLLGAPTLVGASGGEWANPETGEIEPKLHLHWRLTEPTRDSADHARLKEVRRLACALVGADASAVPVNHPLRWPGSVHRKGAPRLARIVSQTENEIELADALDKLRMACPQAAAQQEDRARNAGAGFGFAPDLAGDPLDIAAALAAIPNVDLPWDAWNKIAMATQAAGGAFAAFDAWSRKAAKYDPVATADRWEHVVRHPANAIGAGTLFFLAQQACPGWRKPSAHNRDSKARPDQEKATHQGGAQNEPPDDDEFQYSSENAQQSSAGQANTERATISYQGILVPTLRDRLEIALSPDPAPAFPTKSLPPLLREMVEALKEHVQAPESLCAHSVLSAAALATQGLADIKIPSLSRAIPISLFMLAVAASGERKSSCDNLGLKAVADLEARLRETYAEEMRRYKAEKAAHDGEVSKIKSDKKIDKDERIQQIQHLVEPTPPTTPTIRAEEPNLEGLMNLLVQGRPSIGVFTAEGGSFLGGHGMSDDAKVRTITGLSKLYDNGSGQRIRAQELTFINNRRVSISLAVQPRIAAKLLGDEMASDQGFVGRFLACMPDSTIGTRTVRITDSTADLRINAFQNRMARLLELQKNDAGELKLDALQIDAVAWEVWRSVTQAIEDESGATGMWRPVIAMAQRIAENIARLAGIFHLFSHGKNGDPVSGETMAIACDVGLFYLKEAMRLSGAAVADTETRAADDLARWLTGRPGDLISPTVIQRTAPNHLRVDAKKTRAMVQALCAAGVLELIGAASVDGVQYREVYKLQRGGKH